jgi:protein-disulfide isomerase
MLSRRTRAVLAILGVTLVGLPSFGCTATNIGPYRKEKVRAQRPKEVRAAVDLSSLPHAGPTVPHAGPSDAVVTIHWGYSHECPHCRAARRSIESLRLEYNRQLRVLYYPIALTPLSRPEAVQAARRAACTGPPQGNFFQQDDALWVTAGEQQKSAGLNPNRALAMDSVPADLAATPFTSCPDVDQATTLFERAGLEYNHGFIVEGISVSGQAPTSESIGQIVLSILSKAPEQSRSRP